MFGNLRGWNPLYQGKSTTGKHLFRLSTRYSTVGRVIDYFPPEGSIVPKTNRVVSSVLSDLTLYEHSEGHPLGTRNTDLESSPTLLDPSSSIHDLEPGKPPVSGKTFRLLPRGISVQICIETYRKVSGIKTKEVFD